MPDELDQAIIDRELRDKATFDSPTLATAPSITDVIVTNYLEKGEKDPLPELPLSYLQRGDEIQLLTKDNKDTLHVDIFTVTEPVKRMLYNPTTTSGLKMKYIGGSLGDDHLEKTFLVQGSTVGDSLLRKDVLMTKARCELVDTKTPGEIYRSNPIESFVIVRETPEGKKEISVDELVKNSEQNVSAEYTHIKDLRARINSWLLTQPEMQQQYSAWFVDHTEKNYLGFTIMKTNPPSVHTMSLYSADDKTVYNISEVPGSDGKIIVVRSFQGITKQMYLENRLVYDPLEGDTKFVYTLSTGSEGGAAMQIRNSELEKTYFTVDGHNTINSYSYNKDKYSYDENQDIPNATINNDVLEVSHAGTQYHMPLRLDTKRLEACLSAVIPVI